MRMNSSLPLENPKDSADLYRQLHNLYYNQGLQKIRQLKLEIGKDKLKKAITFDDSNEETWNLLGLVYYRLGRYKQAICCWDKSIEVDPDNSWATDYRKEAEKEYEILTPYLEKLNGFVKEKDYRKGKKLIEKMPIRIVYKVDFLNYFGIIMGLCNEWESARVYWTQSLQLSKDGMASTYLANSLTQNKKEKFYLLKLLKRKLGL